MSDGELAMPMLQKSIWIKRVGLIENIRAAMTLPNADAHQPVSRNDIPVPLNSPPGTSHEILALLEAKRFADGSLRDATGLARGV